MITPDDYKYAYIRKLMLDAVREDLIGPGEENEIITDFPTSKYITGIVYPSDSAAEEIDEDFEEERIQAGEEEKQNNFEEEEEKERTTTGYQKPTSIGISFYIPASVKQIKTTVNWGIYEELPKESEEDKSHKFKNS